MNSKDTFRFFVEDDDMDLVLDEETMVLHNFIRDSKQNDCDFAHLETVEAYEQHGDENVEHVLYLPAGDRMMEAMRDSITMEMARGTRLPY